MKNEKKSQICSACENGQLETFLVDDSFAYKGLKINLQGVEYSKCSNCYIEMTTLHQSKNIDNRLRDEYRKHVGLLSGDEIKRIREKLNINQQYAAALLGGGVNAFSKYERGEVIQSVAMDNLLRVLDVYPNILNSINRKEKVAGRVIVLRETQSYKFDTRKLRLQRDKKNSVVKKTLFKLKDVYLKEAC